MASFLTEFLELDRIIVQGQIGNFYNYGSRYGRTNVSEKYAAFAESVESKLHSIVRYEDINSCITHGQERACVNMIQGMKKWAADL